jgi:hypothetical protein
VAGRRILEATQVGPPRLVASLALEGTPKLGIDACCWEDEQALCAWLAGGRLRDLALTLLDLQESLAGLGEQEGPS